MISRERLTIDVKLLKSANKKSCMPRRLAQRTTVTFSDLELPFHASRAISAVAAVLVSCDAINSTELTILLYLTQW